MQKFELAMPLEHDGESEYIYINVLAIIFIESCPDHTNLGLPNYTISVKESAEDIHKAIERARNRPMQVMGDGTVAPMRVWGGFWPGFES